MDDKERLRQELQDRKYELNREFEALKDSPLVQQMKRKAAVVPISAGLFSLVSLAVARRVPTTRPILFGSGLMVMGGLLGAQMGAFWLRSQYYMADPEGRALAQLKSIVQESSKVEEALQKLK